MPIPRCEAMNEPPTTFFRYRIQLIVRAQCRCFRLKMHQQSPVFQTLYRTRYRFAPIADANRQFPASENFPLINQIILFRKHIFRFELLGISQHYSILLRIDFQHISWFSQCDFKSFPLPDGIVRKALMLSQLHSFRIDKPSGPTSLSISGECSRRKSR